MMTSTLSVISQFQTSEIVEQLVQLRSKENEPLCLYPSKVSRQGVLVYNVFIVAHAVGPSYLQISAVHMLLYQRALVN